MTSAAYISVADAEAYLIDFYGVVPAVWGAATVDEQSLALRRATRWLDQTYGGRWKGVRATSTQVQDHPRTGLIDRDGFELSGTTTALVVRYACAEAGVLDLAGDLDSIPASANSTARIVEKSISAGGVSKSVRFGSGGVSETRALNRRFPLIEAILRDVLESQSDTVDMPVAL